MPSSDFPLRKKAHLLTFYHLAMFRLNFFSRNYRSAAFAGIVLAIAFSSGTSAADSSARANAESVRLPAFEVRDTRTGAYNATEATSTTRISVPIQFIPQSVSVVTRELIDDTQGLRMMDVARFASPVLESAPRGGERYSIRGFSTSQRFIDGVSISGLGNNMVAILSNVERLEIIKGPNAILVPGGGAGGIVNQITKSPKFENFGELSLRARTYYGSEASVDAGRVFARGASAARLVATVWESSGYAEGSFRRGHLFAPSFTHRFSEDTELILKLETLSNLDSVGTEVTIDPTVGTEVGGYARKHPLLPRDNLWGPDTRRRRETRLYSELRFKLPAQIAGRVWVMADRVLYDNRGAPAGAPVAGPQGARNPLTGAWEPFKMFAYDPGTGRLAVQQLTPSADTRFDRVFGVDRLPIDELHLKNDYAAQYEMGRGISGTTITGLSANHLSGGWQNWITARPRVDYASGRRVGPDEPLVRTLVNDKTGEVRDLQVFLYQRFNLLKDRFVLAGGVSRYWGVLKREDDGELGGPNLGAVRNAVTDATLGAIAVPVRGISLFAGYNRVGGALPSALLAGEVPAGSFRVGVGEQWEYGIKAAVWEKRLTASVAYFEIDQSNVAQLNSARSLPNQPTFFFFDLDNRGWDVELAAQITPELEVIGNSTWMRLRDRAGVRQRMVPDSASAIFAKYTFRDGRLKGLGLSFGLDYMDKVAGDQAAFATAAGVPNQPSFYLAPRTLLQAGLSYRRERWSIALMVHNLTNKDYIQASMGRNSLQPGDPRNLSFTYGLKW